MIKESRVCFHGRIAGVILRPTWCQLLVAISCFIFSSLNSTTCWGQAKNTAAKVADRNWVEQVEPGVQLIGRPKSVANYLDSDCFTMTPDGKVLVGARGRELCVIDWDAQELIRVVKMPFQHGSGSISKFQFSTNGTYLMVWLNWYGRPYDPADEIDLDEFKDYWFNLDPKFPYETFRGDRLLIYNSDYRLLHDLELTYDPERVQDPASPVPHWVTDIYVFEDDARAVVIGSPKARVINLESGKFINGQELTRNAIPVGYRVFDVVRRDGRSTGFWWDPTSNVLSEHTELLPAAKPMLIRPAQTGQCMAMLDGSTSTLTISRPNAQTLISIPKMGLLNNVAGTYSPDGRYYIFPAGMTITLVDLLKKEIRFQFAMPYKYAFGRLFFRPQHDTLLVQCGPQIAEIAIDEDFETNMLALANLVPRNGPLHFANQDQQLLVANDCVVNLQNGTTLRHSENNFTMAVSPTANLLVRETHAYLSGGLWRQLEIGPLDRPDMRLLYSNVPALNPAIVRLALGISDAQDELDDHQKSIGTETSHLSFSPDGETLRHVYVDSGRSIRLRLTHLKTRALIEDQALESAIIVAQSTVSPDGRRVAIFRERKLEVIDATDGRSLHRLSMPKSIHDVCLDRRGDFAAVMTAGEGSWTVCVIDLASGDTIFREDGIQFLGYGFRPGSDQFYLATREKTKKRLRLFDRDTWEATWEHATNYGPAYRMAMSQDGTQAAFGLTTCHIELWKLSDVQREK
ncbi:MAG: hypothetical protein Q8M16_02200 [Pirellulaceae bacterium]|nr:hypothetical protein [Pirellulaceae bacterium]